MLSTVLGTAGCTLQTLGLSYNGVRDLGAEHLRAALVSGHCGLTALDLSHNRLSPAGCALLAEAVRSRLLASNHDYP